MNASNFKNRNNFSSDISNRLRTLERGYVNRETAALAFGTTKGALSKWIYETSIPSFLAMARVAKATGVSLDWLAFGTETPNQNAEAITIEIRVSPAGYVAVEKL